MTPEEFVTLFHEERASAILRTPHADLAAPAMDAAVRAGFRIVEFTLTIPKALRRIEEFSAQDGLVVGAGTVLSPEDARNAVHAGARFLVSPVVDPDVVAEARRLGVAMMPGTFTPTEMLHAHRLGAPLQKLFPGPAEGPAYVRACKGPLPFLNIVPTSGVTAENVAEYFAAGAWAVGFVAPLFDPALVAARDFDAIESRGRDLRARL